MKLKSLLLGAVALITVFGGYTASAQTEFRISGATAFRTAALEALLARFQAGGSFRYAHQGTSFTGSTYAIFEGTYPGIAGTTIVRTSFRGSVRGLQSLVDSPASDPSFLPTSVLTGSPSAGGTVTVDVSTAGLATQQAHAAFSDVNISSSPFGGGSVEPSPADVGVVVFTMLANDGAPSNLTNVTNKQFEALFRTGIEELSLFTGDASDNGSLVAAVGRNDGSGTRTTYMAETGIGIVTTINQFIGTQSGGAITALKLSGPSNQPSEIWSQNIAGNGGYSSGGDLRSLMQDTSSSVDIYFDDNATIGVDTPDISGVPVTLITFLSIGDAVKTLGGGAVPLAFNGVSVTPASPLSQADQDKVAYGAYSAWGFQQFYRIPGLSADQLAIDTDIRTNIGGLLGSAGLPLSAMQVTRTVDGGLITSL